MRLLGSSRRGMGLRGGPVGGSALALIAILVGLGWSACALGATVEIGRCQKVPSEQVGKHKVYHGAYTDSGCRKSSSDAEGKYEWTPGPGTLDRFSSVESRSPLFIEGDSSSTSVTECSGEIVDGEFTGIRTFSESIVLTGCSHARETCVAARDGSPPECETPCDIEPANCEAQEFFPCSSEAAQDGEVRSGLIEGEFGVIPGSKPVRRRLGVRLHGGFGFVCNGEGVGIGGTLVAPVRPSQKMTQDFTASFNEHNPDMLEGMPAEGFSARPTFGQRFAGEVPLELRVLE